MEAPLSSQNVDGEYCWSDGRVEGRRGIRKNDQGNESVEMNKRGGWKERS